MLKRTDFREYQETMLRFALDMPELSRTRKVGAGELADMGSGKTAVGATWLAELISAGEVRRALVVSTKANVAVTWPREFRTWEHLTWLTTTTVYGSQAERIAGIRQAKDKALVTVVSYGALPWLCKQYKAAGKWPFQAVIFDESTAIKNVDTQQHRLFYQWFAKKVPYVMIMTGTPSPQGYQDLWGQVRMLDDGERLGRQHQYFVKSFGKAGGYMNKAFVITEEGKPKIREAISDICIWVDPSEYLTLGKEVKNFIRVPLPKKHRELYAELEREFILELDGQEVTAANAAVLSGKLRQLCNGFLYDVDGVPVRIHEEKLDALAEIVSNTTLPVLIAVDFTEDAKAILERFPTFKFLSAGDQSTQDEFNAGKLPGCVGNAKSISRGLNLQWGTNVVIWLGMTWSGETYLQMNARCGPVRQAQAGLNRGSIVHHIVIENSVEDKIMTRLATNIKDQDALTDFLSISRRM